MIDITKRIFITGGTGFIGANLVHRLVSLGANDVHILVRENSNISRIESIKDNVTFHKFSLENREETLEKLKVIKPQIVYHIAALGTAVGRVPFSFDELMESNTLGTIHLMDAAIEVGCECFVNTGSSSEYGEKDSPMLETDLLEPNNLYAISKIAATQYVSLVGKQRGFPVVTYRLFSVYGPFEEPKRLIPTLVQKYLKGAIPQLSSPNSVRDFIYIDDVVDCFLEADKAGKNPGEIINIGTGIQYSIQEVVDILKEITHSTVDPIYGQQRANQHEPKSWVANNMKMITILGINPVSLEQGLGATLQWMRKNI